MNKITKINYTKGMNMDISKTKYPQSTYYTLHNGTLISGDNNDATEISTIKGNNLVFTLPTTTELVSGYSAYLTPEQITQIRERFPNTTEQLSVQDYFVSNCPDILTAGAKVLNIIGYVSSIDHIYLFCINENTRKYSSIFRVLLSGDDGQYANPYLVYINDNLNFNYVGEEALCVVENENITKLYWADGVNQLGYCKVEPDMSQIFKDYTQLKQLPDVKLSRIEMLDISLTGSLPVGMVQYTFQYFNKNSNSSVIMPLSDMFHLTTEHESVDNFYAGKAYQYHGADSGQSSNKAIKIYIPELDQRYESIRIVRLFHTTINDIPEIKIIHEQTIDGLSSFVFTDDGTGFLGNLSVAELTKINIPIIPRTIATKDSILFAANIVEDSFNSDYWDNFCARSYRFDKNHIAKVYNTEEINQYTPSSSWITIDANNGSGGILPEDSIDWQGEDKDLSEFTVNPYNIPELTDPDVSNYFRQIEDSGYDYKYSASGNYLGGTGPNVSFSFTVKTAVLDNGSLNQFTTINNVWPIWNGSNPDSKSVPDDGIFTNDYKSPFIAGRFKTYQKDDIYRFAIVVYSKLGVFSYPKWIADIRMPNGFVNEFTHDTYSTFVNIDNWKTDMNILGVDFKINFPIELRNEIQGFSIVRAKRDSARHITGSGVLFPYVYSIINSEPNVWGAIDDGLGLAPVSFPIKNETAVDRDSLSRDKTSKDVNASLLPTGFINYTSYMGIPQVEYSGFAMHYYNLLNDGALAINTQVTDSGVCGFICPEDLFSNNLNINKASKIYTQSFFKLLDNISGIRSNRCLWSDFKEDSIQLNMSALKLTNNIVNSKQIPLYIEESRRLSPLDDIKLNLEYTSNDGVNNIQSTREAIVVNGMIYGESVKSHVSFGTNMLLRLREDRSTQDAVHLDYPTALRNNIRVAFGNDPNNTLPLLDPQYLMFVSIKQFSRPYGGQSLSSILNTEYISTGNLVPVNDITNNQWLTTIARHNSPASNGKYIDAIKGDNPRSINNKVGSAVFGGDIFLTYFQYLSQHGTDLTTEDITTPVDRYSTSLFIPVESTINCNLRHDTNIFTISKDSSIRNIGEKALFRASSAAGTDVSKRLYYHDYAQEKDLYLYNTVYSKENELLKYISNKNKLGISGINTTRIIASLPKLYGEYSDSWLKFGINPEIELPSEYGDIVRLYNFKEELYTFQPLGIARLAVNDKTISQDVNNPLILGTTGILDFYKYVTTKSGTSNKYSIASTEDFLLYLDTINRKVMRLSDTDGSLSATLGMNSYFQSININSLRDSVSTIARPKILSAYDNDNKQILISMLVDGVNKVLVYNKLLNVFTHFIDTRPFGYINTALGLYSVTGGTISSSSGAIWRESARLGLQNTFYGNYLPMYGTLIVNPTSNELIKLFDYLEFMTTSIEDISNNEFNVLNLPLTSIRVYTDYQDTEAIDLLSLNSRDQYYQKQRNRTFRVSRLRDKLDTNPKNLLARLKDYFINIDFIFDKTILAGGMDEKDIKFTLKDTSISYRDLNTTQI